LGREITPTQGTGAKPVNHRQVSIDEFLAVVKANDGKELTTTVRHEPFKVEPWHTFGYRVHLQSGEYIGSTPEQVLDCLKIWNETGEIKTPSYLQYTRTASYFLVLIKILDPNSFK